MLIHGKNPIKEAIMAKRPIFNLYIDNKFSDPKYVNFLNQNKIRFTQIDKGELNNMTDNANHQGIVANVLDYEYHELEDVLNPDKVQRFIILDEITDPHNLGAILRTAEGAGIDAVIVSKRNSVLINPTVVKVSSGAVEYVKVVLATNINQTIMKLKDQHVLVIGTDDNALTSYEMIPKDVSTAIVLGNEGVGIRPLVKRNCDLLVKIPMKGSVSSLNVSVAAALMMYITLI